LDRGARLVDLGAAALLDSERNGQKEKKHSSGGGTVGQAGRSDARHLQGGGGFFGQSIGEQLGIG
jgi:hypothetical protein